MRKLALSFMVCALPLLGFAQSFLEKMEKFVGQEDNAGILKGTAYTIVGEGWLENTAGETTEGILRLEVGTDNESLKQMWFTPQGTVKEKKVKIKDINRMQIADRKYAPVRMKEDDGNIGNVTVLMEQLHEKDTDKFKMYMLRKVDVPAGFSPALSRRYYVVLPEFKNAHEIVDLTFTPFAKKMSKYLSDCPTVSEKISKKEEGYKYNMFKGAGNDAVFYRIMNEYNACAQ